MTTHAPRTSLFLLSSIVAAMTLGPIACKSTEKVAEGARGAGEGILEVSVELSADAKAARQTMDVKAALMADRSVDASEIDVDTSAERKTLTLKGHVPNIVQRAAAERIARAKSDGYTVMNKLKVRS